MTNTTKAPSRKPRNTKADSKPLAMLRMNKEVLNAITTKPYDYDTAVKIGSDTKELDHDTVMILLAGSELPTWEKFSVKAKEFIKTLDDDKKVKYQGSLSKVFSAINQQILGAHEIREIETELGFNTLEAYNNSLLEATRKRAPSVNGLLKLARAFKNGGKDKPTPMEIFEKGLKLAYKGALEFKDSKQAQARVSKLLAMAQADGITLEAETETDAE
jgi:hypothetical protein